MPILETSHQWQFAGSTGTKKAINLGGESRLITVGFETSSGCTGTIGIEGRMGSSAGPYGAITVSTALSAGSFVFNQASGPLKWVRPRLQSITAGGSTNLITVYLMGN